MSGFDIHIESLPLEAIQDCRFLTFGDYGRVVGVRGIQKMVNRFMKCLMTPIGSDISDLEYGTQLADSFLGNVSPGNLFAIAAQSVAHAEEKIREYDSLQGTPNEERLASAEIKNIYVDESGLGVVLVVLLSNVAGTVVQTQMSVYSRGTNNG